MKELRSLASSSLEGIKLVLADDIRQISADIEGPVGTPFEGGVFRCKLVLGGDFPSAPPKAYFMTKIFHPNVSKAGEICVNTLKKDWVASHGISHVLMVIRCLLIHPNAESALNEEAGKYLLEKYEDYASRARLMTQIHAKPKSRDGKKSVDEGKEVKVCNGPAFTEQSPSPTAATNTQNSGQSQTQSSSSAGLGLGNTCVASAGPQQQQQQSQIPVSVGSENAGSNGSNGSGTAPMQGVTQTPSLVDKTNSTALADQSNNGGNGGSNANANSAAQGKGAVGSNAAKPKPAMSAAEKQKLQAKKSLRRL